ncbi:DNA helicase IV [Pseudoalteromonas denitrificans]|uniref:DNA 3'-5' helicase n=1 Tax=Pseudoalteromonas denitrificans DSM 6059 TaxID=1123010 RepID=A0A1I1LFM8_9GAMM|nr:DNA helicase IV [Pseudoalteromonas denitrificans]SFC71839.1 DNA helicase-4 [Pseudoalteromonas denitrificans DSM 6059]
MQLTRHWISKFFIKNHVSLSIDAQGIQIDNIHINWLEMSISPNINKGLFFNSIEFQTNKSKYNFNWLSKKTARSALKITRQYWAQLHQTRLHSLVKKQKIEINKSYLRKGTWLTFQQQALTELNRWPLIIDIYHFEDTIKKSLKFLRHISSWNEKQLGTFQSKYINNQREKYRDYFNCLESNPLTDKQQIACITNEQNNLILAGAGTGKTSTMIGRVGYLLKSNQATTSEFLLLAFGSHAAEEMKLRVSNKLKTNSIKICTFHALGLYIIKSVESKSPNVTNMAKNEQVKLDWIHTQLTKLLAQENYKTKAQYYFDTYLNAHKNTDFDSKKHELAKLLNQLLGLYKLALFNVNSLQSRLTQQNKAQITIELELLSPIYQLYQQYLVDNNEIDFEDMIIKSIKYIKNQQFKSPWRHILVDEFQDISEPRAQLIKALREQVVDGTLFCVGDDWQAIYRFTGADVSLTTRFDTYFGTTKTTSLDKTFRFNNSISDIATQFVMQNPEQLNKKMLTHIHTKQPKVSLYHGDNNTRLHSILSTINNTSKESKSIYILARYKYLLPNTTTINQLNNTYKKLNINALTFHASKGKEADKVIIIGLKNGKSGFPAQKKISPLLDSLLPKNESYRYAEERRLFYVAMTRAKHQVHLIFDTHKPSIFITELIDNNYAIEYNEISTEPLKEVI